MTNVRFFIFGRSTCPFCRLAADYCIGSSIEHTYLDFMGREDILEDYKEFYNQKTVPIVLVNNTDTGETKKIGGYTDLLDYSQKAGLHND